MSVNCDVITIFPIYGQFGAIWNLDSGPMVSHAIALSKGTIVVKKILIVDFFKKMLTSAKLRGSWY